MAESQVMKDNQIYEGYCCTQGGLMFSVKILSVGDHVWLSCSDEESKSKLSFHQEQPFTSWQVDEGKKWITVRRTKDRNGRSLQKFNYRLLLPNSNYLGKRRNVLKGGVP